MKLFLFTIVLDGMPLLPMQLATFNRISLPWHWAIAEGASANTGSTKWCKPQEPRLSRDGTTQFLNGLRNHPRVSVIQRQWWEGGKDQMVQACMDHVQEPCVAVQVDVDELWAPDKLERIAKLISPPSRNFSAEFYCRYFVGPNIVTTGRNCYGNNAGEWRRAWRVEPGVKCVSHEPPALSPVGNGLVSREVTAHMDLVFDHLSWVFPEQVQAKERFYGYTDALKHWKRLQQHPGPWPIKRLKDFLPWVDEHAQAEPLFK